MVAAVSRSGSTVEQIVMNRSNFRYIILPTI
jgi:hypothetical protein